MILNSKRRDKVEMILTNDFEYNSQYLGIGAGEASNLKSPMFAFSKKSKGKKK